LFLYRRKREGAAMLIIAVGLTVALVAVDILSLANRRVSK
jgi:hypothetical protein